MYIVEGCYIIRGIDIVPYTHGMMWYLYFLVFMDFYVCIFPYLILNNVYLIILIIKEIAFNNQHCFFVLICEFFPVKT